MNMAGICFSPVVTFRQAGLSLNSLICRVTGDRKAPVNRKSVQEIGYFNPGLSCVRFMVTMKRGDPIGFKQLCEVIENEK